MLPHTIDVTIKGDRSYEAAGAAVMTHVPRRRLCFFLPHIFSQSLPLQAACIFSLDRQLSQFRAQTLHFFAYYPRTVGQWAAHAALRTNFQLDLVVVLR